MNFVYSGRAGLCVVSRRGVYFEPPNAWPVWLHLRTCSHCRGILRYFRKASRPPVPQETPDG